MIKFFRKIRYNLMSENKTSRYLKYAIGEIILVVIGILIALYLNQVSQDRNANIYFEAQSEEVFNSLHIDLEKLDAMYNFYNRRQNLISGVLAKDSLDRADKRALIIALHVAASDVKELYSETPYFLSKLNPLPENDFQNELVRGLTNYTNSFNSLIPIEKKVSAMLSDAAIPYPKPDKDSPFGFDVDNDYYTEFHVEQLLQLFENQHFLTELKNLYAKTMHNYGAVLSIKSNALSLISLIEAEFQDVKLIYKDVGIIGTSLNGFDNTGGFSTPMIATDKENLIWETTVYLKVGKVKFRCRDSWAQNWGGKTFPTGLAEPEGPNIDVPKAGNYKVILNLGDKTYQFIEIDD